MRLFFYSFMISLLSLGVSAQNCSIQAGLGDVSMDLKLLGNIPAKEGMEGRERNIWDLQSYENRIFIGYGHTNTNPGPIQLYAYNPLSEEFEFEVEIKSEAIERLRVFNGTLFVPNSDPTAGDKKKYLYKQNGVWNEISSSPDLAHIRDLYFYNNKYYLIGNTRCPESKEPDCSGIIEQNSIGNNNFTTDLIESELLTALPYQNHRWNWFYGFLEIEGNLIAPNAMFTSVFNPDLVIKNGEFFQITPSDVEWSTNQTGANQLSLPKFYPVDTTVTTLDVANFNVILRPFEQASFNNDYLYTLRTVGIEEGFSQEAYNNTKGLIFKDNLLSNAQFVDFPDGASQGEDLLIENGHVYALANTRTSADDYRIFVYRSSQPSPFPADWELVFYFNAKNRAKSFEYLDGKFYFGMGNNHNETTANSGMLIAVNACNPSNCPPAGSPCDDGDPCTTNDRYDGFCGCQGVWEDTDNNGICDALEGCPSDITISSLLQFDQNFKSERNINFSSKVNLESNISLNSDTILLGNGSDINSNSTLDAQIAPCTNRLHQKGQ